MGEMGAYTKMQPPRGASHFIGDAGDFIANQVYHKARGTTEWDAGGVAKVAGDNVVFDFKGATSVNITDFRKYFEQRGIPIVDESFTSFHRRDAGASSYGHITISAKDFMEKIAPQIQDGSQSPAAKEKAENDAFMKRLGIGEDTPQTRTSTPPAKTKEECAMWTRLRVTGMPGCN